MHGLPQCGTEQGIVYSDH